MRNKTRFVVLSVLMLFIIATGIFAGNFFTNKPTLPEVSSTKQETKEEQDIPASRQSDWELVLVNRDHRKAEMNPSLAIVDGIYVDERIVNNVQDFLAAAREIDPQERLISGYRSVAYQAQLYDQYIETEMVSDPKLTYDEAVTRVNTYSQPPGASEHATGLAIDMSNRNSLNESPADIVLSIMAIAPDYGFILRFPVGGQDSTGIEYEDWHWRYVGVENAKYITKHNLTLEQYLQKLPK